jgi:hypothetical protein
MRPVHPYERLQRRRQPCCIARIHFCPLRHAENVIGDLAPPLMLCNKDIGIAGRRTAPFLHRRKDVPLFQFLLMVLFAEGAK